MKANQIKEYADKFFRGETTRNEERLLKKHFSGKDTGESPEEDRMFFLALDELGQVPNADEQAEKELQQSLSKSIDLWSRKEKAAMRPHHHAPLYWWGGIAASILLLLSYGIYRGNMEQEKMPVTMSDTYSNPVDAAEEAQKALIKFSTDLNRGLRKVSQATE